MGILYSKLIFFTANFPMKMRLFLEDSPTLMVAVFSILSKYLIFFRIAILEMVKPKHHKDEASFDHFCYI